eukprot:NODE_3141_length_1023_cov_27.475446_g2997_i0.p1 GENE.NODE_3141_length_1023_cov_27.475446_g2997_i0~~NODE_3141_length_1023_cov_27.475446_g2997_i0.p1  ORF type:complete len:322 (-),score=98.40 NODE_3141_length_1023_cov_27.475446_g2997_i0:58-987(-)
MVVLPAAKSLTLAGRLDDENYQKTFECIEFLKEDRPAEYAFTIKELFPHQWEALLRKIQEQTSADQVPATTTCLVYSEDLKETWCGDAFVEHILSITNFKLFAFPPDSTDPSAYKNQAKARYNQFLRSTGHSFCYIVVSIDGKRLMQQIVFELFIDVCPRTCENFRHLCIGDCKRADASGTPVPLHYQGCQFFRIVKGGWIQSGDTLNNSGTGGASIYGPSFPDESFSLKHDGEGILGMANCGKNSNGSQFYITVAQNTWMDRRYVAFGRVIQGLSIIQAIHALPTRPNQMPEVRVVIEECGEIDLEKF